MASHMHPSNPLALAVLALLFERPMHPYEMAATLKHRHKSESIKIRYGSLYTVIEFLVKRGFIAAKETSREGKRPERTVFALTPSGYDELRAWMQDLLCDPVNEFPQFAAGLSLLPVLPPDEAVALLRHRALRLSAEATRIEAHLAELTQQEVPVPPEELPLSLSARSSRPSSWWKPTSRSPWSRRSSPSSTSSSAASPKKAGVPSVCGASCKRHVRASMKQTLSHGRAPCKPIAGIGCPGDAATSPGPEPENRTRGARWLQARGHKLAAKAPREQVLTS